MRGSLKASKKYSLTMTKTLEEMNSLWKNDTYELTELPKGRKALTNKWVFKLKNDDEKLLKYKARLVVKAFGQKQGINFDEIFSPVVKMCSI